MYYSVQNNKGWGPNRTTFKCKTTKGRFLLYLYLHTTLILYLSHKKRTGKNISVWEADCTL